VRIRRLVATEVVVPAREGAINSPELDRPLHRTPFGGRPGWTLQFDVVPKLILQAELDNGHTALGECHRGHDWSTVASIASRLLTADIEQIGRHNLDIADGPERIGFECLIWDAVAKTHDMALVDLLGGRVREHIPIASWSGHRTPKDIGGLADYMARLGYTHLKFKCDLEDDVVALCAEVARIAPALKVTIDPNERWLQPYEAKRRLACLAEIGNVHCVEDPIPRSMLDEYRDLRGSTTIPLALHIDDALRAIGAEAVDAFNFTAGPSSFMALASIATAAGMPFWLGSQIDLGILEALYVHIAAAVPGSLWPCDIFGRLIRSHDLLQTPLTVRPPVVHVPEGPGLGVTLDSDAVARYATRREELTVA
jgi:muconate cycloisomerase